MLKKTENMNESFLNESKYKLWNHKFDFAEMNKRNFSYLLKDYFSLTTKKVTFLALLLAVEVIMTLISKFILGMFPIGTVFFVMEISFFVVLLVLMMSNLFYAMIVLQSAIWMRIGLGSEVVGLMAMSILDGAFLIIYAVMLFIFKYLLFKYSKDANTNQKKIKYASILIAVITILLISALGVLINYAFLLDLYNFPEESRKATYGILFVLNIAKYSLNFFIYFLCYKTTASLINIYKI